MLKMDESDDSEEDKKMDMREHRLRQNGAVEAHVDEQDEKHGHMQYLEQEEWRRGRLTKVKIRGKNSVKNSVVS